MERIDLGIEVVKKTGKYLKEKFEGVLKLKETKYDIKLLQDIESEKIIIEEIQKNFPEDSLLSEEVGLIEKNSNNIWIIDPIDGTLNFYKGIPHACIAIAFTGENEKFGIVYDFFKEEIFTGIKGKGAFLNDKKIKVSKTDKFEDAILGIGFMRSKKEIDYALNFLKKIIRKVKKIRIMGSASLDICYVASGRIDLAIHLGLERWDYEGAKVILEEAGGRLKEVEKEGIRIFEITNKKLNLLK